MIIPRNNKKQMPQRTRNFYTLAETEKEMKRRTQEVDIIFNFVGEINSLSAAQPKRQGA